MLLTGKTAKMILLLCILLWASKTNAYCNQYLFDSSTYQWTGIGALDRFGHYEAYDCASISQVYPGLFVVTSRDKVPWNYSAYASHIPTINANPSNGTCLPSTMKYVPGSWKSFPCPATPTQSIAYPTLTTFAHDANFAATSNTNEEDTCYEKGAAPYVGTLCPIGPWDTDNAYNSAYLSYILMSHLAGWGGYIWIYHVIEYEITSTRAKW